MLAVSSIFMLFFFCDPIYYIFNLQYLIFTQYLLWISILIGYFDRLNQNMYISTYPITIEIHTMSCSFQYFAIVFQQFWYFKPRTSNHCEDFEFIKALQISHQGFAIIKTFSRRKKKSTICTLELWVTSLAVTRMQLAKRSLQEVKRFHLKGTLSPFTSG